MKSEVISIENRNRAATEIPPPRKGNSSSYDPNAPDQDIEDQDNLGNIYNNDKSGSFMSKPEPQNGHGPMEVKIFFLTQGGRAAWDRRKIFGTEPT
jgi:hypothetical protein